MAKSINDAFTETLEELKNGEAGQKTISGFLVLCPGGDYLDIDGDEATLDGEYTALYDTVEEAGEAELLESDDNEILVSDSDDHSVVSFTAVLTISEVAKTGGTVLTEAYKTASQRAD